MNSYNETFMKRKKYENRIGLKRAEIYRESYSIYNNSKQHRLFIKRVIFYQDKVN